MNLRLAVPAAVLSGLILFCAGIGWQHHTRHVRAVELYRDAFQRDHRGDFEGEETALREAIRLDPHFMRSYYLLGRYLYFREDKKREAARMLSVPIAYKRDHAAALQCLGFICRVNGARANALACFERAIAADPSYLEAHFSLGSVLVSMQDYPRAARVNENIIRLDPEFADAHSNLGVAYERLGRTNDAIAADRRAVAICPGNGSFWFNLGLHTARVDPTGALSAFETAVALDPSSAKNLVELSGQYERMGNLTAAAKSLETAVGLSRTDARSRGHLAEFYERTHRPKDAARIYQQILRINPADTVARDRLAVLEGRPAAREALVTRRRTAAEIMDWNADAHRRLGEAYDELGDPRSLAEFEAAARLSPTSSICRVAYAEALDRSGNAERAEVEYRAAIKLDPYNLRAYDKLDGLLYRLGRYKEGADVLRDMEAHATSAPGIQDMSKTRAALSDSFAATARVTAQWTNSRGVVIFLPATVHGEARPGFDARDESTYGPDDFIQVGTGFMIQQEDAHALELLEKGLKAATNELQRCGAAVKMAAIYRRTNRSDEGLKLYDDLVRRFPEDRDLSLAAQEYRASASSPATTAP